MSEIRRAAEAFLRDFHRRQPGATRIAYARGRVAGGRSSYELLADHAPIGAQILDVGCGDGWLLARLAARGHAAQRLVGIDLSAHELGAARAHTTAARLQARAEDLPFARGAFGACLSHLAFSILPDPAAAAIEIARVVAPGGVFAIVTGGGPGDGDAFDAFLEVARPYLAAVPPAARAPRLGDKRARHADGLDELLGPAGFGPVAYASHTIDLGGDQDRVWATLATTYELATLSAEALAALGAEVRERLRAWGAPVPCTMRVGLAAAVRRAVG